VTIDGLNHRTTSYFDAAGNLTGSADGNNNVVILAEIMAPKT
jgi:hypothetical protein